MSSTIKGIVAYPITPFDRDTGAFDPSRYTRSSTA